MNNQCKSQVFNEDIWHNAFAESAMKIVIALLLYRGKYSEALFSDGAVVDFNLMKMFTPLSRQTASSTNRLGSCEFFGNKW